MRLRFKTILTFIFLLIVACASTGIGYVFYTKVINDETVVIVDGDITINYLNGNEFSASNNEILEFSVTNNSSEESYYYIQLSDVKGETNSIYYEIKSNTNDLNITNNLKSEIVSNYIAIEGNKTDIYTVEFKTEANDKYSGKIVVGTKLNENNNFADTILKNNEIKEKQVSVSGENAVNDEGLIKTTDDLGDAYYFRGNVTNNYVYFAGNTWRIVKINGDGSIKIVLNTITDVLASYYENSDYIFSEAVINESLDNWYKINLDMYSDYIANYKYCNDYVIDETTQTYAAYSRIVTNKIPNLVCLGSASNDKIGLLTADEVMLAGASTNKNDSYYLYNKDITTEYYTMTSAKISGKYMPFTVTADGALSYNTDGTLLRGVRPVINIIKNSTVTGTGTSEDPYIINTKEN